MDTMLLARVIIDGKEARMAERWNLGKIIRDVAEGPDGSLWLLEDGDLGGLIHVTPK
jgi:glucose/arabinose dehydrogenase